MHFIKYKKTDEVVILVEIQKENEPVTKEQSLKIDNVQPSTSAEKIESQVVCIYNNGVVLRINSLFLDIHCRKDLNSRLRFKKMMKQLL